jgi:hypothetical protein
LLVQISVDAALVFLVLDISRLTEISQNDKSSENFEHVDDAALLDLILHLEVSPELFRVIFLPVFGPLSLFLDLLL